MLNTTNINHSCLRVDYYKRIPFCFAESFVSRQAPLFFFSASIIISSSFEELWYFIADLFRTAHTDKLTILAALVRLFILYFLLLFLSLLCSDLLQCKLGQADVFSSMVFSPLKHIFPLLLLILLLLLYVNERKKE